MKRIMITAALIATMTTQAASAQGFGMLGDMAKGMMNNNNSTAGGGTITSFYASFLAARIEMNEGQIELSQAFDLKDEVTLLEAEQTRLKSGPLDADGMKKSKELSNATAAAINAKMATQTTLSDEGKQHFDAAIPHLMIGTLLAVKLVLDAKNIVNSASMFDKAMLVVSLKDVPDFVKTSVSNYKNVINYGKANQIPMPKDATDALGTL